MGGPLGAIGGKAAANKTYNESQRSLNTGNLGSSYSDIENLLLGYDDLVAMGRINPGSDQTTTAGNVSVMGRHYDTNGNPVGTQYPDQRTAGYEGLSGNQSRFGRGLESYFGNLAAADPAFAAYRDTVTQGLNFDENGLPQDVSRGITQGVRSSSSARGLLDSGTAGLEEVAALMGGKESLRAGRLAQVNQYLGSAPVTSAIAGLFPGISTVYQGELQRAMARAGGAQAAGQVGASVLGASS